MRHQRIVAVGASMAAVVAAAVAVPAASASATTRSTGLTGTALTLVQTRHSLLGTHRFYQETFHGLPVVDGYYVQHVDRSGHVTVDDARKAVPAGLSLQPAVTAATAQTSAAKAVDAAAARQAPGKRRAALARATSQHAQLAVLGGSGARLVWRVTGSGDAGSTSSVVDARTGALLSQRSLVKNETGQGKVFNPNPVVALRDESLKDHNDGKAAVPQAAYKTVPLKYLDGSGLLHGTYARIDNDVTASSSSGTYDYDRHDNRFEQVSAYYDITAAQDYLRSLGFTDVNAEAQDVKTDIIPDDNSFYDPAKDQITFGRGGVDDAEDEEVVWHELGHAIQDDQVPGFGETEEGGAIGEGFGDYWAVTMSVPVSNGFDLPCVMDWDSTSYTSGPRHCLRRVDGTKTTADVDGEVHDDGEIWSRALWDIHNGLGRTKADKVIIESQFSYAPDTTFAAAANRVVATARTMYGASAAATARKAFADRGIL